VIYDLVDDVKAAASGLLSDEVRERFIGYATIKEVFKVSGVGKVAGCLVTEGVARRSAGVRLLRDNVVIHEGTLKTLKRFKDEVKEVISGQECGMAFENYEDIREGDVIEIFERETVERTLQSFGVHVGLDSPRYHAPGMNIEPVVAAAAQASRKIANKPHSMRRK
jgi:translation initiation factor IF-2